MLNFNNTLSNYSLFSVSYKTNIPLEPDTALYSVGVCGSPGKYYCYYVNYKGKIIYSNVISDFQEALNIAKEQFYKRDCARRTRLERYRHYKYYTLFNEDLYDKGYVNYLKEYGLTEKLSETDTKASIGLYYHSTFYGWNIYINDDKGKKSTLPHTIGDFDGALSMAKNIYSSHLKKEYGQRL